MSNIPTIGAATSTLTPSSSDWSVQLLNNLFGPGWNSYLAHAINGGGSAFFTLLAAFNSVILAGVVLMAAYVYGVGIVGTAHEGKPLGERYHTVWTPLRTAFALFLLAPLPGVGISVVQGLVLLMAWFSIGGANFVTHAATHYMADHAGALSLTAPTYNGRQLALATLEAETTQAYLATFENADFSAGVFTAGSPVWKGDLVPSAKVYADKHSKTTGNYVFAFSVPSGMQAGALGHISVPCTLTKQGKTLCDARLKAIQTMAITLHPLAVATVAATLPAGTATPGTNTSVNPALFATAIDDYQQTVADAAAKQWSASNPGYATALKKAMTSINQGGWSTLGAYYWTISNANAAAQHIVNDHPSVGGFDPAIVAGEVSNRMRFSGMLQGLTARLGIGGDNLPATSSHGKLGALLAKFVHLPQPVSLGSSTQGTGYNIFTNGQTAGWMGNFWSSAFGLDGGDPIARLQSLGNGLFNTVWLGVGGYTMARAGAAAVTAGGKSISGIPLLGWVTGPEAAAAGAWAQGALRAAGPYLFFLFLGLLTLAFVWAFYLPSVPFILWISAVFGWVIQLIEALVASVLWAATISVPQGEGMLGHRGEQGLMLFLQVLFRPALMVVGFFASFMLVDASMRFVGKLFVMFVTGMEVGHLAGLVTFVSVGIIASTLIVTLLHKVFGLITWVPDNVLNWVGHGATSLGEHQDEQHVRQGFIGAVGRGHGAAGGAKRLKDEMGREAATKAQNKADDPSDSGNAPTPDGGGGTDL